MTFERETRAPMHSPSRRDTFSGKVKDVEVEEMASGGGMENLDDKEGAQ